MCNYVTACSPITSVTACSPITSVTACSPHHICNSMFPHHICSSMFPHHICNSMFPPSHQNAVDKATQAITDHYEGLLRECEGRWRQEAARGREEAARRTRSEAHLHLEHLHTTGYVSFPPLDSHRVLCDFGCQTQLVVMEGLEVKIQERIELTRQSLKRDIAQLVGVAVWSVAMQYAMQC